MWERGLKRHLDADNMTMIASLPMWERGLKPSDEFLSGLINLSLPMWERGLKLFISTFLPLAKRRSPCGSVD